MDTTELIDLLAAHATLGSAPRSELEWLARHGALRTFAEHDVMTKKGDSVEAMFIILAGHIVIFVDRGAGPEKVMEWKGGDVTGMLPYSRMVSPPGSTVAFAPTTALAIHRDHLRELTRECHEVTSILVHAMIDRARQFKSNDLLKEKMASLGRLTARLTHELNNPIAAIERSASHLEEMIDHAERATLALGSARLTDAQFAAIDAIRTACTAAGVRGVLSPIEHAEREDSIADWLTTRCLDPGLAVALAETSVTLDGLTRLEDSVGPASLDVVLRWTAAGFSVRSLASDIQDAAARISGLVTAAKGFTHMDRGEAAEPVDLSISLSNTVALFKSKARDKATGIDVTVDPALPCALGFVGELNQVWANLIDNALDAAPASGRVDVTAAREGDKIVVRVIDNGPGISPEVRERMFEPFFTTKPVGQGTGNGLDIVRRLLAHNNAAIDVTSAPGRTQFSVYLPVAEQQAVAQS
jgi:signal transduction histidine kinase